jgi:hypothetical protein
MRLSVHWTKYLLSAHCTAEKSFYIHIKLFQIDKIYLDSMHIVHALLLFAF